MPLVSHEELGKRFLIFKDHSPPPPNENSVDDELLLSSPWNRGPDL